jgi:RNA polymerase sigma-70 factor, ECF subfamily
VTRSHRIPREERWLQLAPTPVPPGAAKEPLDDDALIDAVVRGDIRAAREFYDRLIAVVQSTLFRLVGKAGCDHEDLVQVTFEQIVLSLVRGRFSRGCRLSTWASSVAAHVAFNALRARRRARVVFDPIELGDVADRRAIGDGERDASARQQIRAVQGHLAAMSPKKAMVLVLHDVLGHELADISVMLGISVSAAQSRLVRGRRELLGRLGASGHAQEEQSDVP